MTLRAILVLACLAGCGSGGLCAGPGEEPGIKLVGGLKCCPGLQTTNAAVVYDPSQPTREGLPDGCVEEAPPDAAICLDCGNGTCDDHENFCNCPADCERDTGG